MSRRRLMTLVAAGTALLVAGFVGVVVATSGSSAGRLVVYTARSHYGEEQPFKDFAERTDTKLTLFGGEASELYERIRSEGDRTRADLLITVDAANLWRATEAGLLEPVNDPEILKNVPADVRDPGNRWFGLTTRARTIMRSTERVGPTAATTYEDLGDPRWRDKVCLRSGTSDYNVSFVADRIAKDGEPATETMLRRWMANDPKIFGSDTDVLDAIKDGDCDVGLTNSYYLGRELHEDPGFPVAPVWADQNGRGTHVNLSGLGVVKGTGQRAKAIKLIRYLTEPAQQRLFAHNNFEFAADAAVPAAKEIAQFGSFKRDPIDVKGAGEHLDDALQLMQKVGWD